MFHQALKWQIHRGILTHELIHRGLDKAGEKKVIDTFVERA